MSTCVMGPLRIAIHEAARLDGGSITRNRYFGEIILPLVRPFQGAISPDFVFMDDDTQPYKSHAVQKLLEREGILRTDWFVVFPLFESHETCVRCFWYRHSQDTKETFPFSSDPPSHVNIAGNEIADSLARAGAGETTTPAAPLTYLELFSKYKAKNKAIWMIPPVHPWYQSERLLGSGQQ
ncbi:RNase H domain-containing protein [Trichonephila clavipes]|nr:RNase H domain-containing protein [Trichonephila clavipes]